MLSAGLDVQAAWDFDPAAVRVHNAWHPSVPCELRDCHTVAPDELAGRFVWASPSCKPYSNANRYANRRGKKHAEYYPFAELAWQTRLARVVVIENVPGLVESPEGRAEMAALAEELRSQGRAWCPYILRAADYGVPQLRRRVIIVIGALPLFGAERQPDELYTAPVASEGKGGPGRPARTVVTTQRVGLHRAPTSSEHPGAVGTNPRSREVNFTGRTLAECAALQGVPVPQGMSLTAGYRLVGNAVPPRMAAGICRDVLAAIADESEVAA
ncbi:MAG TPA: DNA cytosine methyltransferase, partial [Deinococcales bacterium]|nr:DNA cytosine methyltransferase [Deinococcales bacterium]